MGHAMSLDDKTRPILSAADEGPLESALPEDPVRGPLTVGTCALYQGRSCNDYLSGQRILIETTDWEAMRDIGKETSRSDRNRLIWKLITHGLPQHHQ